MLTSSNGTIFPVTGPLWGESTGHRWIPLTKVSDAELWCFLWFAPEPTVWNNRGAGDFWCHRAQYDVTVMLLAECRISTSERVTPWPPPTKWWIFNSNFKFWTFNFNFKCLFDTKHSRIETGNIRQITSPVKIWEDPPQIATKRKWPPSCRKFCVDFKNEKFTKINQVEPFQISHYILGPWEKL